MMQLATFAFICSAVYMRAFAMDALSVELQTRFLTGIYETVKDRQLKEGELNLLRNESAGFASSIRSFTEKGTPGVTDGNRAMTFDLSLLTEPKQSQILIQLAIMTPTEQYFQSVRHLHLYNDCSNCAGMQAIAHHTVLNAERNNEWLELTIECASCDWGELEEISLLLHLTDENNLPITFNEERAANLKSFLILYTYNRSLFLYVSVMKALEKRQVSGDETPSDLQNRTTVQEVRDRNVSCSRHEVLLTTEELQFEGTVIAPHPAHIQLSYCLGECNSELELPSENITSYDIRTRILIHQLRTITHPPPCCIPSALTPLQLIVIRDGEVVELDIIPDVVDCKCQL